jgi:hypothetical protein
LRQQCFTLSAANLAGYEAVLIAADHASSEAAIFDHTKRTDTGNVCQPSGVIPANLVKA